MWQYSLYFSDSYKANKLTLTWGLRFDHQDDRAIAANIAANPILPDLLPAVNFTGADGGATYDNLAPRVGVAYDVKGTGRAVECGLDVLPADLAGTVLVTYGDVPLLTGETLAAPAAAPPAPRGRRTAGCARHGSARTGRGPTG